MIPGFHSSFFSSFFFFFFSYIYKWNQYDANLCTLLHKPYLMHIALQFLLVQVLTLISSGWKLQGVTVLDESLCPWPGCLCAAVKALPHRSQWLDCGTKQSGQLFPCFPWALKNSWGTGYGIDLLPILDQGNDYGDLSDVKDWIPYMHCM